MTKHTVCRVDRKHSRFSTITIAVTYFEEQIPKQW